MEYSEKEIANFINLYKDDIQIRFTEFLLVDEFTDFGANWILNEYEGVALIYGQNICVGGKCNELTHMVRLQGTDDTSYSMFFTTEEQMLEEVEFLRNNQPLNFEWDDYCNITNPLFRHYQFTN